MWKGKQATKSNETFRKLGLIQERYHNQRTMKQKTKGRRQTDILDTTV